MIPNATLILGPPGCGKTYKLIERVEDLEKDSHPPKNWREIIRGLNEEIKILKEKE